MSDRLHPVNFQSLSEHETQHVFLLIQRLVLPRLAHLFRLLMRYYTSPLLHLFKLYRYIQISPKYPIQINL